MYFGSENECAHLSGGLPESRAQRATQVLSRAAPRRREGWGCWHAHSAPVSQSMRQNGCGPPVPRDRDSWFPSRGYHSIIRLCPRLPAFRVILSPKAQPEKSHSTCEKSSLFSPQFPAPRVSKDPRASAHLFHRSILVAAPCLGRLPGPNLGSLPPGIACLSSPVCAAAAAPPASQAPPSVVTGEGMSVALRRARVRASGRLPWSPGHALSPLCPRPRAALADLLPFVPSGFPSPEGGVLSLRVPAGKSRPLTHLRRASQSTE